MIGMILTAAAIGFIWLMIWSLCRVASLADQNMERECSVKENTGKRIRKPEQNRMNAGIPQLRFITLSSSLVQLVLAIYDLNEHPLYKIQVFTFDVFYGILYLIHSSISCLSVVCGELTLSQFALLWIFFSSISFYNQPTDIGLIYSRSVV